uniref:Uncharacterized protein n=1 Tax=Setaria italica TaxID=4555 RepID=K3ZYJ7_SETIT
MTTHTVWLNLLLVSEFSEEPFFYSPIDASSMCTTLGATNFVSLVDFAEENFRQLQVKSGILSSTMSTVIFFPCLYRSGHILDACA